MAQLDPTRYRFTVTGQVQGVGFRPFVYRLAVDEHLVGSVLNDASGVTIEVQGEEEAIVRFGGRLQEELPPLASIASCQVEPVDVISSDNAFEIRPSTGGELADAQVTVDTAICDDCLRELRDPDDPRFGYPFINCTNCGPRYSIVQRIPYDRPNTTMSTFWLCPLCTRQYGDPADRRFHAQPVACPACGPTVWLVDHRGERITCDNVFAEVADMLIDGRVVAIKGLGGFQLCCRADDGRAVDRLRRRKNRDAKPFALMVSDLAAAEELCKVDRAAAELLGGHLRPIVIMPRRKKAAVADGVADELATLGVMLPTTPLHVLVFDALAAGGYSGALVATSGNAADQPLVKDNDAAVAQLGRIADAIVLHDRPIEHCVDDSVVQATSDGRLAVVRRARGYAPQPVRLEGFDDAPAVLAVGAELKSAVCLLRQGTVLVSAHIGDLKDGRTYRHFADVINSLEELFEVQPQVLAVDMHPQYLSTDYALRRHRGELTAHDAIPAVRVQHHHAHIVSCMVEHGRSEPVIGLACDGVGYGDDGAVWGGEVMVASLTDYDRVGHLKYLPLVGGDKAATETWRPALAALVQAFGKGAAKWARKLDLGVEDEQIDQALDMLAADVNCPPSSSLGRWFDAAAGLAGLAVGNRYEGEAPMHLEAAIKRRVEEAYPFTITSGEPFEIDLRRTVKGIVSDVVGGEKIGVVAAKFHNTVSAFLLKAARRVKRTTKISTVALSGGCFANRYLTARLSAALEADGFEVLRQEQFPCNDGGVALGQAVVAAARARDETSLSEIDR
jgi:hydrogenase maturation protein HypF